MNRLISLNSLSHALSVPSLSLVMLRVLFQTMPAIHLATHPALLDHSLRIYFVFTFLSK